MTNLPVVLRQEIVATQVVDKLYHEQLDRARRAVDEHRFVKAQECLKTAAALYPATAGEDVVADMLRRQVEAQIIEARTVFVSADATDAKTLLQITLNALAVCADLPEALAVMRKQPPKPPLAVTVRLQDDEAVITWEAADDVGIERYDVLRSTIEYDPRAVIFQTKSNEAWDPAIPVNVPVYYTIFSVRKGIVSPIGAISPSLYLEVKSSCGVVARMNEEMLVVEWVWGDGVKEAKIIYRTDQFPVSHDDPAVPKSYVVTKEEYQKTAAFKQKIHLQSELYIILYDVYTKATGNEYREVGRRILAKSPYTISYRLIKTGFMRRQSLLCVSVSAEAPVAPRLVLVINASFRPRNEEDGAVAVWLKDLTPGQVVEVPLSASISSGSFARLFLVDHYEAGRFMLVETSDKLTTIGKGGAR